MTVLSLFDGMSCGQIALRRAGIEFDHYYASEIEKASIKVTQKNYPDTIQLGDVTKVSAKDLPKIDLLMGGSPCQGFSIAGKGLAFDDPRSALIMDFFRILEECRQKNPDVKYLLENVPMAKEHEVEISRRLGINPIRINAALVSAQNRDRVFWTNIGEESGGLFGHPFCAIPQPQDKGIILADILEPWVDEKYYLSERAMARIVRKEYSDPKINPEKAGTLNTKNNSGQLSVDSGTTLIQVATLYDNNADAGRVYSTEGKGRTLKGDAGGGGAKMGLIAVVNDRGELRENGAKSMALDANFYKGMDNHGQRTMVVVHNSAPRTGGHKIAGGYRVRRLTPTECERLQCVPDGFTDGVSDTARYKMLGNGWNVDVIVHILKYLEHSTVLK